MEERILPEEGAIRGDVFWPTVSIGNIRHAVDIRSLILQAAPRRQRCGFLLSVLQQLVSVRLGSGRADVGVGSFGGRCSEEGQLFAIRRCLLARLHPLHCVRVTGTKRMSRHWIAYIHGLGRRVGRPNSSKVGRNSLTHYH